MLECLMHSKHRPVECCRDRLHALDPDSFQQLPRTRAPWATKLPRGSAYRLTDAPSKLASCSSATNWAVRSQGRGVMNTRSEAAKRNRSPVRSVQSSCTRCCRHEWIATLASQAVAEAVLSRRQSDDAPRVDRTIREHAAMLYNHRQLVAFALSHGALAFNCEDGLTPPTTMTSLRSVGGSLDAIKVGHDANTKPSNPASSRQGVGVGCGCAYPASRGHEE